MKKKWEYYKNDDKEIEQISKKYNISNLLANIIMNRGITEDKIENFLNPKITDFYDPFLMPDMEIATRKNYRSHRKQRKTFNIW